MSEEKAPLELVSLVWFGVKLLPNISVFLRSMLLCPPHTHTHTICCALEMELVYYKPSSASKCGALYLVQQLPYGLSNNLNFSFPSSMHPSKHWWDPTCPLSRKLKGACLCTCCLAWYTIMIMARYTIILTGFSFRRTKREKTCAIGWVSAFALLDLDYLARSWVSRDTRTSPPLRPNERRRMTSSPWVCYWRSGRVKDDGCRTPAVMITRGDHITHQGPWVQVPQHSSECIHWSKQSMVQLQPPWGQAGVPSSAPVLEAFVPPALSLLWSLPCLPPLYEYVPAGMYRRMIVHPRFSLTLSFLCPFSTKGY